MEAQTVASASTPDTPRKPRRPAVYTDYDQRSVMVAAKHIQLVVGFSYVTAWRKRKQGLFPAPIRISVGRVAWRRADLEDWLASQASK
jgi:prophage regulatory protein